MTSSVPAGAEGEDPGMYGSAANKASDLLYEVGSWLHDVACGDVEFDAMHDALDGRLVPAADAALGEARSLAAALAAAEQRADTAKHVLREAAMWVETFDCDCFGGSAEQDAEQCDRCYMLDRFRDWLVPAALSSRPPDIDGNHISIPGQPEGKQR